MKEQFELRKQRDFGQVFNDTFAFFKNNLKPLLRALFVICGFFMLSGAVSSMATYLHFSSPMAYTADGYPYNRMRSIRYILNIVTMSLISVLTQYSISLVTLCYMAIYREHKGRQGTVAEVWGYFKYYFRRVFGASLLLGMLTLLGFLCCVLPGIYFTVVFSLVPSIMVMENTTLSDAFGKSFRLISGKWWLVFGVIFVIGLLVGIANSIAGVPLGIVPVVSRFVTNQAVTAPLIIFFSILRSLLVVTYTLISIAITLCYFSLSEEKEGTGLMARIGDFGKQEPENEITGQDPSEEY